MAVRALLAVAALALLGVANAGNNYTCTVQGATGLVQTEAGCVVTESDSVGRWQAGATGVISFSGTAMEDILAGAFQYQVFEESVEHFTGSGNSDFFTCDNKGCDRSDPISLALTDPGKVPTTFVAKLPFTVPAAKMNGRYHLAFWGIDNEHNYAINGLVYFHLECFNDSDCPTGSYCVNDPTKAAPYACH
uniref:Chitin-binding type-4 domain-containing protein n=1 Tax=Bicosoecida sp. CB-2014 TaxID=1486930 RepID=A0A7S1CNF4_9STRA|mmetsp:Transcript_562/g.1608  ORF Transcript_562/g.1608 Transcript_562/m.1608 type:complete len:191 (+) Transcript_562:183-755(+)